MLSRSEDCFSVLYFCDKIEMFFLLNTHPMNPFRAHIAHVNLLLMNRDPVFLHITLILSLTHTLVQGGRG